VEIAHGGDEDDPAALGQGGAQIGDGGDGVHSGERVKGMGEGRRRETVVHASPFTVDVQ
jgi:hypothetical protein